MRLLTIILTLSIVSTTGTSLLQSHFCGGNIEAILWIWQSSSCQHHEGVHAGQSPIADAHVALSSCNAKASCCKKSSVENKEPACCNTKLTFDLEQQDWLIDNDVALQSNTQASSTIFPGALPPIDMPSANAVARTRPPPLIEVSPIATRLALLQRLNC